MRSPTLPRATVVAFTIAALVACSGGQIVPASSSSSGAGVPQIDTLGAQLGPDAAANLAPFKANPLICATKTYPVPGTYPEMISFDGAVKGTTYQSKPGYATMWSLTKYVKAKPTPTPAPTNTPTSGPTTKPVVQTVYYYYGTYSLKKYGVGCAYVITTVNGKPIHDEGVDALAIAYPNIASGPSKATLVASGPLVVTVKNLSASGGKGSVFLHNAKGGGLTDSGTITLTGRISQKVSF